MRKDKPIESVSVTCIPHEDHLTEIRAGNSHVFDVVPGESGPVILYKAARKQAVYIDLKEMALTLLRMTSEEPVLP